MAGECREESGGQHSRNADQREDQLLVEGRRCDCLVTYPPSPHVPVGTFPSSLPSFRPIGTPGDALRGGPLSQSFSNADVDFSTSGKWLLSTLQINPNGEIKEAQTTVHPIQLLHLQQLQLTRLNVQVALDLRPLA